MKKALSVILSLVLILGMVFAMPVSVSAITIEEADMDNTLSAYFDFEGKDYGKTFMKVGGQSQSSAKVVWQIDPNNKLEYFYSAWGFGNVKDNPCKDAVNSSDKAMEARKTAYNNWSTGGGIVINRITEKGIEPLILENNTTYTVELDYLVAGTHIYGDWIDPTDGTKSGTIPTTVSDIMTFGYGYRTTSSDGLAPVTTPKVTVATLAKYTPNNNPDGYYTAHDGTQKEVGKWVHASFTFTTGTFDTIYSIKNAPFLVFYANMFTGAHLMVDNIRISDHVTVNFHGMGGTISSSSASNKVGAEIPFPEVSKFGYEFAGWYTDGSCSVPYPYTTFTKEGAGSTAFAGWKKGTEGFENYVGANHGMNTSRFSVASDKSYNGSKSLKYSWTRKVLDLTGARTSKNNYFPITPLENNGEATSKYKLTFKYYLNGVDMIIRPALVKNASNSTSITTLGTSNTLSASGSGRWQTMSIVFTVTNSSLSTYPNLALYAYASSDTTTTAYFDEFTLTPLFTEIEDSVETIDSHTITVYGGKGNAAGGASRSVDLAVGDKIDPAFVYYSGYAVESWYTDSALNNKLPAGVCTSSVTAVYPKFGEKVDLTANGTANRTGGFAKANNDDILCYNGASGTASLAGVTKGNTYMVEFLYKNKGSADVTLTAEGGSFVAKSGKNDKWYKGYIPVTASATSSLLLSAQGSSELEIKDVYIKDITGKVYILFDSTEFGGELTAVYGTAGEAIRFPANPIIAGKTFGGWFSGETKFTATVFPAASVSLTATMVEGSETVKGDCDGDGSCNTLDLAKLKLYLAKVDIQVSSGADFNGDGKINAIDIVLLSKKLAGN